MQSFISALRNQRASRPALPRIPTRHRLPDVRQPRHMDGRIAAGSSISSRIRSCSSASCAAFSSFRCCFSRRIAGSAADRYSRKTLLLVSQAINALLFAALALLIFTHLIQPWHVYATAVLAGIMQVIQHPARTSIVSDTVPMEYLTNAIGLTSPSSTTARGCSGLRWPARSSLFRTPAAPMPCRPCFCSWRRRGRQCCSRSRSARQAPARAVPGQHRHGLALRVAQRARARRHPLHNGHLAVDIPVRDIAAGIARDLLGVGAGGQGLLLAAMGVGALISAGMITLWGHKLQRGKVMLDSSLVYAAVIVVFAFTPWYWLSLAIMIVAGYATSTPTHS